MPTPGGRPGRGPARPRWRRGSSPTPRPGGHRLVLHHRPPGRPGRQRRIPGCHDRAAHCPGPSRGGSPAATGARVGAWLSLLAPRQLKSEERARRLVVVVDGLDEDDAGATPPGGRPSIASLLPRRPPRRGPGHRHQPSPIPACRKTSCPVTRCAPASPSPAGVGGGRGPGAARQAGTAGPAHRRSDRDRRGRLHRRVWRRPDRERPVGSDRGSPAEAGPRPARRVRPQPADPRIRGFPQRRRRSGAAGVPVRA